MIRTEEGAQPLAVALAVAVVVSAALEAIYYYGGVAGQADDTPLRAALVGAIGATVAGVIVWRWTRGVYADAAVDRVARRTAALGVVALVSLAGFWIGITVPVCVAAAALGHKTARLARPVLGHPIGGLGTLVLIASVVLCTFGAS